MEYITDQKLLRDALESIGLSRLFDFGDLQLQLAEYHKGELLAAPFKPMDRLLFLVRGRVSIYGLREDGSSFSVYLAGHPVLLGDIEFIRKEPLPFYTEALDEVLCVALAIGRNRERLERDVWFLNFLMRSVADKFGAFFQLGSPAQSVAEKLVAFLRDIQPDHILHGINAGTIQLHCSRSQLQRVVRRLCGENVLERLGKGKYRLV